MTVEFVPGRAVNVASGGAGFPLVSQAGANRGIADFAKLVAFEQAVVADRGQAIADIKAAAIVVARGAAAEKAGV